MRILFYYPSNKRTIPIDVPLLELKRRGHTIFVLTQAPVGPLHSFYQSHGVVAESAPSPYSLSVFRFIYHLFQLARFCRKQKIDIVHSHLQQANIVAVIAQVFLRARVIVFRHHCKFHFYLTSTELKTPLNERLADKIINKLARRIVLPAESIRNALVEREHVAKRRISIIPYAYEFDAITRPHEERVRELRTKYPARLKIIMVSRLTPFKRHLIGLSPIVELIREGMDIRVLVLDDGPERERISQFIHANGCSDRIHLVGFQEDVEAFLAWSDILLHPSLTEASNSAVKEAGALGKIVLVCAGVGDFNEYIVHNENGLLLSPEYFAKEARKAIFEIYNDPGRYKEFGPKLRGAVKNRFRLTDEVVDRYENL